MRTSAVGSRPSLNPAVDGQRVDQRAVGGICGVEAILHPGLSDQLGFGECGFTLDGQLAGLSLPGLGFLHIRLGGFYVLTCEAHLRLGQVDLALGFVHCTYSVGDFFIEIFLLLRRFLFALLKRGQDFGFLVELGLCRFHFRLGCGKRQGRGLLLSFRLGQLLLGRRVPVKRGLELAGLALGQGDNDVSLRRQGLVVLGFCGNGARFRRELPGVLCG